MFRKRILLLFFWSIIIHHTGISQDVKFFRPEGDISQNTITSIVQDAKGFLWFGTQHGLNQYNGVEFKSYFHHLDEEEGLSNSAIGCLYAGTEGNLWIGTLGGGLSQFNIYNQSFIPIHTNIKAPISDHIIHTLYEDRDGDLWMGTEENGLKLWDRKKQTLHHFFFEADKKNTIGANHVRAITQDKDGIIWIANWDGGFFLFHKEKELFTKLEGFPQEITARTIHQGQDNKLWLGTEQGIACFLQDERRLVFDEVLQRAIGTYTVLSIVESQDAKLWISTENNGLFLFDTQTKAIQNFTYDPKDHYSIQNNSVWCIFEDRQQTLWVGLFKSGINKVDPFEQKFNHITDGPESKLNLSYGLVSSFAEDESGNLWVGTDGGGLSFIDKAEDQLFIKNYNPSSDPPLGSKEIVDIATDHRDQLWIGTWGEGLFIKNKQNEFRNIVHDPDNINSPSGNDIMRLHRDAFNHMWIATHRIGMDLYVPDTEQFYHFVPSANANSISLDKILAIASHPKGYVWLGSEDGGLDRVQLADDYTLQEVKTYKYHTEVAQGLVRNGINDLYLDSKDRLWIATDGGGLNRLDDLDGDKFELLTTKDGLPSNVVYGILEESSEVFWVSTNAGLARIDLAKQEVRVFDLADGLQAREFTRGACYKTKDNTFLFGGINGYNYFNPKDIQHNTLVPPVYITDLTIQTNDPESISPQEIRQQLEGRAVSLAADENDIAIEFAALNYSQASKNQYFFKLENYDSRWRDGKNNNTATYTNIPPGNYTFKVKASNNDGVWNEQPTTLKITIRPPWYQTWWAYLLFVLLLGGSLLGIFRILIQRERLRNQLELEHMETAKMQELNQVRSQFFANISHEFKTPLTLIISPLKSMQKKLEKIENKNQVNVMLRNAERLLRLINQILDLSKLESGIEELKTSKFDIVTFTENIASNFQPYSEEQFISFKIQLPPQPIPLYFEKDKMEKILINLISNAFKYTPEFGTVALTMEAEDDQVRISISDTGIGISPDQLQLIFNRFYQGKNKGARSGTGIGLSLTKQLVELHGGKIEVSSQQGQGTQFEVILPLGKAHLRSHQVDHEISPHRLSEDSRIELQEFKIAATPNQDKVISEDTDLPLILIVEDNPDLRAFTRTYLQTHYRIIEAENGKQAYELARRSIPDLIVTDLMMPQMNGFELVQQIRNDEKTSHIFIIMLTVKSSEESRKMGYEYGADYYLTKPFNPKLLDLRIKNILNTREKYKDQILTSVTTFNVPEGENIKTLTTSNVSSKDELFIEKVIEIVEDNLDNSNFQIDDLCRAVGFSKSQLYRKMKGLLGQSANEFIRTVRLKKAAELLQLQSLNVSEITYKVGFNDLQYFRSCFKKQFGVTPSEYAQQFKIES